MGIELMTCQHEDFDAIVAVGRISKDEGGSIKCFLCEVQVKCKACGAQLAFRGLPVGLSYDRPTVDLAGTTATLPAWPENEPFDKDHGLIGYAVKGAVGQ